MAKPAPMARPSALPRIRDRRQIGARDRTGDNTAMEIQLNGQSRTLPPDSTIAALLRAEGLAERRVAVEVNGEIVPRGQHAVHALQSGDRVEIVHALGGG